VSVAGYCDVVPVPLDWENPSAATITIRFEWIPAGDAVTTRTIVAQDGGPGFPSTGSGDAYVRLFGPLLYDRNLLMMDERGTGGSTPIDCEPLQAAVVNGDTDEIFQRGVRACATQLDHTFRTRDATGFVRADDLFATTQSVRDLAAILRALALPKVDLYGDSYGTFFAQAFAANYPDLVHSLVLDSAYPLDQDIFDAPARREIRLAFDAVCSRSAACSAAAPFSSTARIRRLARRLASKPLVTQQRSYGTTELASLLQEASLDTPLIEFRDLDAAARAWLDRGDAIPIGRLFDRSWKAAELPRAFNVYSAGMEVATECTVYRYPFDARATLAERLRQYHAALARLPPAMFDPLAMRDVAAADPFPFDECLHWPAPTHLQPLINGPFPLVPPTTPVLIISGELDSITAPGDAEQARAELGPSARLVSIPNEGHVPTFYDQFNCAQQIVRTFLRAPDSSLETTCTARIPEVRAVGVFPAMLAEQPPATRRAGDHATRIESQLAALAVEAVGDTIESARFASFNDDFCDRYHPCGRGLRGGHFVAAWDLSSVLFAVTYSRDTLVSGVAHIGGALVYGGAGYVNARVQIQTNDERHTETLDLHWDERVPRARASIEGLSLDHHRIREEMPAP
jgi:pimeloyl-ACP methyl ester carboxylesterase